MEWNKIFSEREKLKERERERDHPKDPQKVKVNEELCVIKSEQKQIEE